jgi:hypothetical protein
MAKITEVQYKISFPNTNSTARIAGGMAVSAITYSCQLREEGL